jgi:hypothetical protein
MVPLYNKQVILQVQGVWPMEKPMLNFFGFFAVKNSAGQE